MPFFSMLIVPSAIATRAFFVCSVAPFTSVCMFSMDSDVPTSAVISKKMSADEMIVSCVSMTDDSDSAA